MVLHQVWKKSQLELSPNSRKSIQVYQVGPDLAVKRGVEVRQLCSNLLPELTKLFGNLRLHVQRKVLRARTANTPQRSCQRLCQHETAIVAAPTSNSLRRSSLSAVMLKEFSRIDAFMWIGPLGAAKSAIHRKTQGDDVSSLSISRYLYPHICMLKSLFSRSEPTALKVATMDGDLEISKEESDFYGCVWAIACPVGGQCQRFMRRSRCGNFATPACRLLLKIVDSNCDGVISGLEGAMFLSRSGLPRDSLREVIRREDRPFCWGLGRCVARGFADLATGQRRHLQAVTKCG